MFRALIERGARIVDPRRRARSRQSDARAVFLLGAAGAELVGILARAGRALLARLALLPWSGDAGRAARVAAHDEDRADVTERSA